MESVPLPISVSLCANVASCSLRSMPMRERVMPKDAAVAARVSVFSRGSSPTVGAASVMRIRCLVTSSLGNRSMALLIALAMSVCACALIWLSALMI